jgi:hypothetical protein
MATTQIQLKACGGISPYTWSKTGNVSLSTTQGNYTLVTAGNFPGTTGTHDTTQACRQIGWESNAAEDGVCAPGTALEGETKYAGQVNFTRFNYDCNGNQTSEQATTCDDEIVFTGDNLHIEWTDCNGNARTQENASLVSFGGGGVSTTAVVLPTLTFTFGPSVCGEADETQQIPLGEDIVLPLTWDFRTAAMIAAGCAPSVCCEDPDGATVTVTDWTGISATYVIT